MDKPATDLFVNILVNIGALFRHAPAMTGYFKKLSIQAS
jgi:hypothetical protein